MAVLRNGWLFDLESTYHFAGVAGTYEGTSYLAKILKDSFSGIRMRINFVSRLYSPIRINFTIDNADGTYDAVDFTDQTVTITMLVKAEEYESTPRQWRFKITHALKNYGKIDVTAVDRLQVYITGDYPNTPLISSIFPGDAKAADKSACVPKVFNTTYLPVAPGMSSDKWYYILGARQWDYNHYYFDFLQAPPDMNNSQWDEDDGDFDGYTLTVDSVNYVGLQCMVGPADGSIEWASNDGMLSPLLRWAEYNVYYYNKQAGTALYNILMEFGMQAWYLDYTSFSAIDTIINELTAQKFEFGMCHKELRESFISDFLRAFDLFFAYGEQLSVYMFDSASKETFSTEILAKTFTIESVEQENVDGGQVRYVRYEVDPDNAPAGLRQVPLYTGQSSVDNPVGDEFVFRFGMEENDLPAIFGQLYYQKIYGVESRVGFELSAEDVDTLTAIVPGHVVTIVGDGPYGFADHDVLLDEIFFAPDLRLAFAGNTYTDDLEDAAQVTPATFTIGEDDGSGYTIRSQTFTTANGESYGVWYEEADHVVTPTNFTLNSSYNTLAYTKIGRVVHVQGKLQVSATGSGEARISLPVEMGAQTETGDYAAGSCALYHVDLPANAVAVNIVAVVGESYAVFRVTYDDGSWSNLDGSAFAADDEILIGLTYFA